MLKTIRDEINEIIKEKQKKLNLTFFEDTHTYTMDDIHGNTTSEWPSVSKVLKLFYDEFDSDGIAEKKAKGDPVEKARLLKEWEDAGTYSTNMGSRVHYILEKNTLEKFNVEKEVRKPEFDCDFTQILKGDSMITAGNDFLDLMKNRGAELLDTEIVLGSNILGYVGQPDKFWLIENKYKTEIGLIITDWKTNKPKNFEVSFFTKNMKPPFNQYPNNALGHYYIQLPLYGKLLLDMLKGSKYENIKIYGGIIVLLKEDSTYEEFRIPKQIFNIVDNLEINKLLKKNK